tara:strand:+ start:3212 stop:3883 length:672 start_codon:yes stop_codon:yes gene_type:complete
MRDFRSIYETAVMHKGSVDAVENNLPSYRTEGKLQQLSDDRYLSTLSQRIFRAGLKHAMVDAKWPRFEQVFKGFNPGEVAIMSDEDIDTLMADTSIIRHLGKLKAVRANATWMLDVAEQNGSFAALIASWPATNITGLWQLLKKQGAQLGGQSGARFLRMVGKDTFLLTDDVVAVLKAESVVDKVPSSQRDLRLVQAAFNQWHEESGRPLCEISRIISFTTHS